MEENLILKIKQKKEFKNLPDDIVQKVLEEFDSLLDESEKVKKTREKLRKYFGVFLTNKVVKPKDVSNYDSILKSHISSSKRNYDLLYEKLSFIIPDKIEFIFDLGCGANGFSYPYLMKYFGGIDYIGFDASLELVKNTNLFFEKNKFNKSRCVYQSLFELSKLDEFIFKRDKKCFFCFQVLDALDKIKKSYAKEFLIYLKNKMNKNDVLVISSPLESLSGKKNFRYKRRNLSLFLEDNFVLIEEFEMFKENFLVLRPKD